MKRVRLCCAACLAVAALHLHAAQPASVAPPQPLGRLFFTPTERAQLDVARTQKKPAAIATAGAEPGPGPALEPAPQVITYGGIVRRSDGRATLWINNRAVDEREALSGLSLKGKVRADGAVSLQVPQGRGTIDLKVGQSVELRSGRVAEARKPPSEAPSAPAEPAATDAKPGAEAQSAADGKPAADAKAAPSPARAPPASAKSSDTGGLKMDLGGRALTPAESQALSNTAR